MPNQFKRAGELLAIHTEDSTIDVKAYLKAQQEKEIFILFT